MSETVTKTTTVNESFVQKVDLRQVSDSFSVDNLICQLYNSASYEVANLICHLYK